MEFVYPADLLLLHLTSASEIVTKGHPSKELSDDRKSHTLGVKHLLICNRKMWIVVFWKAWLTQMVPGTLPGTGRDA